MRSRQVEKRGLPPCTKPCEDCPEYLYNYDTLRETWMQACYSNGRQYYERIKYYLNNTFDHHLKEIVFVIAYDADHNAGIFLDFKAYKFFKQKLEKAAETGFDFPEVAPVKLSRKIPRVMRIFTSLRDFIRFSDQLRHKNRAIARQRYVNGVYLLERVNEVMEHKEPLLLALNAKMSEDDPKKVLQIGCVIFSSDKQQSLQRYHYYNRKDNFLSSNDSFLQRNSYEQDFPLESIEVPSLDKVLSKLKDDISQVDFLVTKAMSSEGVRNFFRAQGLEIEDKETIDTLSLHSALFQESRKYCSIEEIMKKLDIPFENHRLLNAGYNAIYTMQMFRALVSQEFCICLNL